MLRVAGGRLTELAKVVRPRYPNWLWKLETPPKHYGDSWHWKQAEMDLESRLWPLAEDLTLMFVHGVNIEEAPSCSSPSVPPVVTRSPGDAE